MKDRVNSKAKVFQALKFSRSIFSTINLNSILTAQVQNSMDSEIESWYVFDNKETTVGIPLFKKWVSTCSCHKLTQNHIRSLSQIKDSGQIHLLLMIKKLSFHYFALLLFGDVKIRHQFFLRKNCHQCRFCSRIFLIQTCNITFNIQTSTTLNHRVNHIQKGFPVRMIVFDR